MAAAQDLLKRPNGTNPLDTEAEIEKKRKAAQAQTGDNVVLQGGAGTIYSAASSSLLNKSGNQF